MIWLEGQPKPEPRVKKPIEIEIKAAEKHNERIAKRRAAKSARREKRKARKARRAKA